MKFLNFLLVLSGIGLSFSVRANELSAFSVFFGGMIGTSILSYSGGAVDELEAWKNPVTNSTVQLGTGCGTVVEAHLMGNNPFNYLFVVVKNASNDAEELLYDQIQMNFSGGAARLPVVLQNASPAVMNPSQIAWGFFPFPSKNDFEKANALTVRVPIRKRGSSEACWIETHFQRNQNVSDARSYTSSTSFEMQIGGGINVLRSGAQRDFTRSGGGSLELGFSGYNGPHWGGTFLLLSDSMGAIDHSKTGSLSKSAGMDENLVAFYLTLGLSYRSALGDHWTWSYDLGPSLAIASYNRIHQDQKDSSAYFALMHRLQLNYRLGRKQRGFWMGDYLIGVSLIHAWVPNGSNAEGLSFGGNLLYPTLHFTVGL